MELFEHFLSIIKTIQIRDVIDILAIALIIFGLFRLVRETRAFQLLKGIILLFVIYFLASLFQLVMLSSLLRAMLTWKKYFSNFFSRFGKTDEWVEAVKKSIEDAADTSVLFSRSKTGALMVFERETMLSDIAATGTIIDAQTSVALFGNIFFNKAPLHDGASIIRDGKLHAAGCILPLTDDKTVDINLGTRHRAALGISEQSDSVVLVVSEETGVISLAVNGVLTRDYTRESLVRKLNELLLDEFVEEEQTTRKNRKGRKKE